jgi:hypothetical protein
MYKQLMYTAFGWLAVSGVLHFAIDVVSQYLRGVRSPGVETTLYYGLNSAFSLGKVAFGLLGLYLVWRSASIVNEIPFLVLSFAAAIGWLAIAMFFIEYPQPKFMAGVFAALILIAFVMRGSQ